MRYLISVVVLSSLLLPPAANAAERGVIKGQIINGATGKPQRGVRVKLLGLTRDRSDKIQRTVVTGRNGRYLFDPLETGDKWVYVLDASHQGGLFPGRPLTIPSDTKEEPVIDSTLKVWDTTSDPAAILVRRDDLFAVTDDENIGIVQSVTVVNRSDQAYIGRGARASAGTSSTLGFPLPAGADPSTVRIEDASIDVPRIMRTSFGFAVTIAIPPGETRFTYSYRVSGEGGSFDLTRTALYPTIELSAFAEEPLEIDSPRFSERGDLDLEGRHYRRWSSNDSFEAGDLVQMLAVAKGSPPWPLFAAVGSGVLVLGGAIVILSRRRERRSTLHAPGGVPAPGGITSTQRTELIAAIVALDLQLESGNVSRDDWESRRAELKTKLQGIGSPS